MPKRITSKPPVSESESTITIKSGGKSVTMSTDQFSEAAKRISSMESRDGAVVVAACTDIIDQLTEHYADIRKAAEETFRGEEDAPAPIAKAGISVEVDYTERARPKIKVRTTWSEKHKVEVEHQLEDPKQIALPLRAQAGTAIAAPASATA